LANYSFACCNKDTPITLKILQLYKAVRKFACEFCAILLGISYIFVLYVL